MSKKDKVKFSLYYWLVGHRTRIDYWGNSKLATWIRKHTGVTEQPNAATPEEWVQFRNENKDKFGYWLADDFLDALQDIWMFIPDVYRRIRIYIKNRYIDKPHYLDTKLEKGEWHEFDTRLVHGMFEALVTFVEDEKAAMHRWTSDEKFKLPNAEMGIKYLEWEMTLKEPDPDNPDMPEAEYTIKSRQAQKAEETLALYNWWKHTRPLRKEPGEEVGLWAFYDKHREEGECFWGSLARKYDEDEEKEHRRLLDASNEEETRQYNEDTEMMIRLVKLRDSLWT